MIMSSRKTQTKSKILFNISPFLYLVLVLINTYRRSELPAHIVFVGFIALCIATILCEFFYLVRAIKRSNDYSSLPFCILLYYRFHVFKTNTLDVFLIIAILLIFSFRVTSIQHFRKKEVCTSGATAFRSLRSSFTIDVLSLVRDFLKYVL